MADHRASNWLHVSTHNPDLVLTWNTHKICNANLDTKLGLHPGSYLGLYLGPYLGRYPGAKRLAAKAAFCYRRASLGGASAVRGRPNAPAQRRTVLNSIRNYKSGFRRVRGTQL